LPKPNVADDFAKETFLPESYYKNNYSPMQGIPNSKIYQTILGSSGNIENSIVCYDQAGRQIIRADFTDHGKDFVHSDPHLHEYVYQGSDYNVYKDILYNVDSDTGMMRPFNNKKNVNEFYDKTGAGITDHYALNTKI
jgi:hypothetical protein